MVSPSAPTTDLACRLLENLNAAVLLFDRQLRLSYLNPAAEVLLAASARQARGVNLKDLFGNQHDLIDACRRAIDSNHPFTERDLTLSLSSGYTITVDCSVTPLNEPNHPTELLMEVMRVDHHRRIVREESLLAQHNASRAVVRGLAHEIKNPLGGLRGAAQLLERELADESLKEYTGIIIGEADRLQALVNRMLGPNTLPQRRLINIHQVVERVRTLAAAEAPPGVEILRNYDPSIPDFEADPDQLIQAVLNIVRNALQAVGERGEIILRTRSIRQATIGHQRHKLALRVDIIDNGPGIAPEMVENIFFPMVTGRPEGTGLGLAIAQDLVNQHRGLIECTSEPGKTVFSLLLPLETNHEQS
jgi:two-component system, NtrC family, nitrogen regulation sensor histidine kinase GlnL